MSTRCRARFNKRRCIYGHGHRLTTTTATTHGGRWTGTAMGVFMVGPEGEEQPERLNS
jgi:hypothetical protein